jgi:DNA polymerase-3 subunit delta
MKPEDLDRSVSKGEFAPLYFIYGEEEFLADRAVARLVEKLVDPAFKDFNFTVLYGKECKAEQILDTAMTLPMFAERRVILVKRAEELQAEQLEQLIPYIKAPSPSACLIFHASKIDQRRKFFLELKKTNYLVEYEPLKYEQLAKFLLRFIQQEAERVGKRFEATALDMLVYYSGNNLRELVSQVEKLSVYAGKRNTITLDDVRCMASDTKIDTVFEFSKALGNRDLEKSLRMMQILLRDPEVPYNFLGAIGAIAKNFRQLTIIRELLDRRVSSDDISKQLKISPFFFKEMLLQAKNFKMEEFRKIFMLLHEFDMGLKGGARYETVLEMFVYEICLKKIH